MIKFLFFFVISFACYIFRPLAYSNSYCIFLFLLYLVESLLFLKRMKVYGSINFHLFFILTNLVVIYLYPIFIYPVLPNFILYFNSNYINQGTALCHLSILGYMIGAYHISVKFSQTPQTVYVLNKKLPYWVVSLLWILVICVTLSFLSQVGKTYGEIKKSDQLMSLIVVFATVSLIWNSKYYSCKIYDLRSFVKYNFRIIIPLVIYMGISLIVGVRFSVLQVLLLLLVAYLMFVGQLKMRNFILLGFVGVMLFTFIAMTRNLTSDIKSSVDVVELYSNNNDREVSSIFYNLYDLICISRNLYVGAEYVEEEGYLYGQTFIPALFSAFPFLPSVSTAVLLDKTPKDVTTQYILTQYSEKMLGRLGFFVGTNCVIDIYMNIGFFLTICVFFIFGIIIQWLLMGYNRSFYLQCFYTILFSSSVFMVRGTIYDDLRSCIWCILLGFLIYKIKTKNGIQQYE